MAGKMDRLLSRREVEKITGRGRTTLYRMALCGELSPEEYAAGWIIWNPRSGISWRLYRWYLPRAMFPSSGSAKCRLLAKSTTLGAPSAEASSLMPSFVVGSCLRRPS